MLRRLIIGVLLVVLPPCVSAVEVSDLYQAKILVSDTSQAKRQAAIQAGLTQVLVKVSGNPKVSTIPEIRDALSKSSSVMQSYAYQEIASGLQLKLQFDAPAVDALLVSARQPTWQKNRPLSIVWLVIRDSSGQNHLVASSDEGVMVTELMQSAEQRALPLLIPSVDLQDLSTVSIEQVAQLDIAMLHRASMRYGAKNILAANIVEQASGWQATCLSYLHGETTRWTSTAKSQADIVSSMVGRFSNDVAAQYLVQKGFNREKEVVVRVVGVHGLSEYAKLISYMSHLTPVTEVSTVRVNADDVLLAVKSGGGGQGLVAAIKQAKDRRLHGVESVSSLEQAELSSYNYQWQATDIR